MHGSEDTPNSWVPKNVFQQELLAFSLHYRGEEEEDEGLLWVKEEMKVKMKEELELELELDLHKSHHHCYIVIASLRLIGHNSLSGCVVCNLF